MGASEGAPTPRANDGPAVSAAGLALKACALGLAASLGVWAAVPLFDAANWVGLGIVAAVTALIFYAYLSPRHVPLKYLLPGTLLLVAFQILPVLYTVSTSVTNFGDGHRGDKEQAIAAIEAYSVVRAPDSTDYALTVAADGDPATGGLVFLLTAPDGAVYAGDAEGLTGLAPGDVTADPSGRITGADGYTVLTTGQINDRGGEVADLAVPTGDGSGIRSSGLSAAYEGTATRTYQEDCDCVVDSATGVEYAADEEAGLFVSADGEALLQGWQVGVGADNFLRFLTDRTVASSFFSILTWNIGFAAGTTFLVFTLGLALALLMHTRKPLRGQSLYRILLVLPYAMPSFAMLLLWRDMFNVDFGLINRMLGLDVDWLGGTWTARGSILLVNTWLGFPYMFLVATGALQAVPRELGQAARIDGASAWQAFRDVTLPLLMVAMTPILISTFAFNFNNFNAVWLTTAGGPFSPDNPLAGSTDLLITYTFRLAFGGQGAQYGFASAVSVFIFLIVAILSLVSLRQSRALEEVR
ncbi:ABC transporter permease subunit [Actinorugispora endophytica]|uniref:Maltose/maltodextrin transport system permease protein n=1 Tax=Actinorugispora endophytica TaxID=1605990 RepID=A0A4R6V726_9ACTN|nr:ABC transporter permease subunit [Actinorugispora endophytica]TDQ52071.1 carbohydrate ABC transporter membrane protein 1 (CUT1 family) [Actinorugispora endophytica]